MWFKVQLVYNNGHQHYLYLDLYSTRDFYILSMQQPKYHVGNFPLDNSCEMINGAIILFLRPSQHKLEILKHLKSVPVLPRSDPFQFSFDLIFHFKVSYYYVYHHCFNSTMCILYNNLSLNEYVLFDHYGLITKCVFIVMTNGLLQRKYNA